MRINTVGGGGSLQERGAGSTPDDTGAASLWRGRLGVARRQSLSFPAADRQSRLVAAKTGSDRYEASSLRQDLRRGTAGTRSNEVPGPTDIPDR